MSETIEKTTVDHRDRAAALYNMYFTDYAEYRGSYMCKANLKKIYKGELQGYATDNYEPGQRAQRLGAAVKNFKSWVMIRFVIEKLGLRYAWLDLTPNVVKTIGKGLFGRAGSQWRIVNVFGDADRTDRASQTVYDQLDDLIEKHKADATKTMAQAESDLNEVKDWYRRNHKK